MRVQIHERCSVEWRSVTRANGRLFIAMTTLRCSLSHAINSGAISFVWLGCILSACVSEPEGLRASRATEDTDAAPIGGESSVSDAERISCAALDVVRAKCGRCHGSPLRYGAPFPLTFSEDFQQRDAKGVARRERAAEAIERGDMPPSFLELDPPVEALSDEERELLSTWLRSANAEDGTRCD